MEFLKKFRKEKGYTAKQPAEKFEISSSLYDKVEGDFRTPGQNFLTRFKQKFPDFDINIFLPVSTTKRDGGGTMAENPYYRVGDVMRILQIGKTQAYALIRRLNAEPEAKGKITLRGLVMKVFFICCVLFIIAAWIILAIEHGESAGRSILDTLKKFFGKDDGNDS